MTSQTRTKRYLRAWEKRVKNSANDENDSYALKLPQFSSEFVDEFQFIVDRLTDTILVRPETNDTKNDDSSASSSPNTDNFGILGAEEGNEDEYHTLYPQPMRKKYCRLENRLLEMLLPETAQLDVDELDNRRKIRCELVYLDAPAVIDEHLLEEDVEEN